MRMRLSTLVSTENTEFSDGMGIYNMRSVIDDIYHLGF